MRPDPHPERARPLRNEPRSRIDAAPAAQPQPRLSAFSPAADVIGSELDLRLTGSHVVHALTPGAP